VRQRRIVCRCGYTGLTASTWCPCCGGTQWRGETNAETLRRARAEAVARGKCYTCRLRDVRPGTRYCDACIKRTADYKVKIAYKKCTRCGAELHGRDALLCTACMHKGTARNRRASDALVAAGICGRCGMQPVAPGHRQCVACLDSMKDQALTRNRLNGARSRDRCSICRELGIEGTSHNRTTHDRWMERRKAWRPKR
jgi:hypothetical protein